MINLKHVSHVYKSKNGKDVIALKDINFTFSDTGLYFLNGKSGCGKSTLLNILSGIDKLQSGEILVGVEQLSKFSAKDYDNYRNNYAGIIFQEFNLIESMTVYENIDMPLKLQGKLDNSAIIAECLKKVDLEGYEHRYPSELSGGQRQRITIARQLAKGSKIILADEPTGSLDSGNSKNVFELLKKLSTETLIIVASHDLEFAQTYADEIITMVDGQITNVQQINSLEKASNAKALEKTKNKFPTSYAFKFALKDIINKKITFLVAVFLCFVAFAMVGMFVTISGFSSQASIARTLVNKQDRFYSTGVANTHENEIYNTTISYNKPFTQKQLNFIKSNYEKSEYIKQSVIEGRFSVNSTKKLGNLFTGNNAIAVIEAPSDINFYGYSLASGYLPLTADSVYITDYYAYVIIFAEYCYLENGECIPIEQNASVYSLVGKTIVKDANSNESINVAGIINTDYMRFMPKLSEFDTVEMDYEYAEYMYLCDTVYTTLFATEEYLNSRRNRIDTQISMINYYKILINDNDIFVSRIYNNPQIINWENVVLYGDSYTTDFNNIKLEKNQMIVTLDIYNEIFNENRTQDYYCEFSNSVNVKNYPTHIGKKVKVELFDAIDNLKINGIEEVEIVGVLCSDIFTNYIYLGDEDYMSFAKDTLQYHRIDFAVPNDAKKLENRLIGLRNQFVLADNYYMQSIYEFEHSFKFFKDVFIVLGSVLLVLSVVIFINFINVTILNKKKDIGIIRAVGGSENNVFKIFFIEGLIFVAIVSVLSVISSLLLSIIMNGILVKSMILGCVLVIFNALNLVIIPLACFIVMLIATYFPIRKISKRSPVDIIRNN